jgi:HD-GYP domain-containing protein (c-di-GMP phosphodiesterase class II)
MTAADAYDAMTSNRPYRKAMTHEEAIKELQRCSGNYFDPKVVEVFANTIKKNDKK